MGTTARRLMIAAIHHGELQDAPALMVLDEAQQAFQARGWQVTTTEIVYQPPMGQAQSANELAEHRRRQRILESQWRRYFSHQSRMADLGAVMAQAKERLALQLNPRYRLRRDRIRRIQAMVTDKHCRAFRQANQQLIDWLLVLESDATLRPNARQGLNDLAAWLPNQGAWFIDLAGGIDDIESQRETYEIPGVNLARLQRPATNTACAYLISRDLIMDLLEYRHANPAVDELAIDWLINAYFLDSNELGTTIECARCEPRILDHGSFTGMTKSWQLNARRDLHV